MGFTSTQKIFYAAQNGNKKKGFMEVIKDINGEKSVQYKQLNPHDIDDILKRPSKSTPLMKRLSRLNKRLHKSRKNKKSFP